MRSLESIIKANKSPEAEHGRPRSYGEFQAWAVVDRREAREILDSVIANGRSPVYVREEE